MKPAFRDHHEELRYAKIGEVTRWARQNPAKIDDARAFVSAQMLTDSHQRAYVDRWLSLLALPVKTIIDTLLADNPEGDLLRDTAPTFGRGLTSRDVAELIGRLPA